MFLKKIFRNFSKETTRPAALVGVLTFGSRALGLLRDSFLFSALGASGLNSAFLLAFTLPNLFRRLLGEGALTTAFIPVLAQVQQQESPEGLNLFVNQVLTRLLALLLATSGLVATWLIALKWVPGLPERWYWAGSMGLLMLPYLLFVCLTAALTAVLNMKGRFGLGAFSPVWLNLCMIGALFLGLRSPDAFFRAWVLCFGVLLGGVIQLSTAAYACWRQGFRFSFNWERTRFVDTWLGRLVPGLWGAGIIQFNIVFSRLIAFSIDAQATAILYLANRLIEFPLGMFTMAIASVIFPKLSKQAAQGDFWGLAKTYQEGLSLTLGITIPAALGLIALSEPILLVLFQWGAFSDPLIAQIPLCFFAASIPFYSISILATRALHALGDAKLPARWAFFSLVLNVVLSLLLLSQKTCGLAAASFLTIVGQSLVLHRAVLRKDVNFASVSLFNVGACLGALAMAPLSYLGWRAWEACWGASKQSLLLGVPLLVSGGAILYGALRVVLARGSAEYSTEACSKTL